MSVFTPGSRTHELRLVCYSRGSSEPGSARLGCPKGGLRPAACLRQLPFKATNARFSHITAAATWLPQSGSRIAARRVFCQQVASGRLFPRLRRIGSKNFGGIRREFTTTETNKGNQMRENLSLLSYWGLILTLIAVTLFVVVYIYMSNTGKGEERDMVEYLRRRSVAIYLAAASSINEDISSKLRAAADEIERLRAQNYVLFWLIIGMNAVVVSFLAIAYKNF